MEVAMAPRRSESPESVRALVSWKAIAVYLNRSESTVKRWEQERGLPVHRVPGGERGGVFAYSSELTNWLQGNTLELAADDDARGTQNLGQEAEQANTGPDGQFAAAPTESRPAPAAGARAQHAAAARVALWLAAFGLASALIVYFFGHHARSRVQAIGDLDTSHNAVLLPLDSVAVLPFTNAGGDARSDYLSDGITEALIGNLAHIPQLKVRSRDSVFRLKRSGIDVKEAGIKLGVSAVVSGRVAVDAANNIQIIAELTDVRDNTEIWGKQFAGQTSQLLQLQQQIASDIAEKLRSTLTFTDKQLVTRQGTQSPEAYTLYLQGRYLWNQRTLASFQASIPYFHQAIAKDPNYALAYSALADVYSRLPYLGGNPAEDFAQASKVAREALRLDPALGHPHAILGSVQMEWDWDFAGGEIEFNKAFALDPSDATAHQWFAEILGAIGNREQDALSEINQAELLDPTSPIIQRVKGSVDVSARRYDEAIAVCQALLAEYPNYNLAHDCLAYAFWGKGMYAQVLEQWNIYFRNAHNANYVVFVDAADRGFNSTGWRGALTEVIHVLRSQREVGYSSPYFIARYYADLGDNEDAFEWLNVAYREHDFLLVHMNTDFQMDNLRSDVRFKELVQKVGLPKMP
jgi:TolB-like protein